MLGTIRGRVVALLLLAACPLVVIGGLIAYQNSRLVADQVRQIVALARDSMLARQRALNVEAERLLTVLTLVPALAADGDGGGCAAILQRVLSVAPSRYDALVAIGPDGRVRCATGGPPPDLAVLARVAAAARARPGPAIGPLLVEADGSRVSLPLALAIPAPAAAPADAAAPTGAGPGAGAGAGAGVGADAGSGGGALIALVNERKLLPDKEIEPLRAALVAWLIGPDGRPVPLGGADDADLPAAPELVTGEWSGGETAAGSAVTTQTARSRSGPIFVYAGTDLPGGLRVLLGEPSTASLAAAELVLGRRLAELSLILLAGLSLAAFGADRSVGRPLKQVSRAVARWRAGGRFDAGPLHGAPAEIAALAHSFAVATAALRAREQQLRDATAQQELLMQEIHHRVKNNLQVVASLLNLQASRIRQPEARAEFHAARDRIRALATLHRHLYAHGELHTINMRAFLEELCAQLLQAMGETASGGRIALTIEAPELQLSSDQAVPMALLVTEAVSNAVKYAFPGGRSGHIAVRLAVWRDAEDQQLGRLSIADDGVGMPVGPSETEAGVRDGLGLHLIHGFARQLGAELRVLEGHGTQYEVDIMLTRERSGALPPADEPDPDVRAEPEAARPAG